MKKRIIALMLLGSKIFSFEMGKNLLIKEQFEKQIIWLQEGASQIKVTRATTPDLPHLSVVHLPESFKEEFDSFFECLDTKDYQALGIIYQAMIAQEICNVPKYSYHRKRWPKSIYLLVDEYIKKETSCAIL